MGTVLRAGAIYVIVWLIFRLSGRRTMSQLTTFDFVLLLLCSEAVQQALLGRDFSVTGAMLVVLTFVELEGVATWLRAKFKRFEKVMEGVPLVILEDGELIPGRLKRESIDVGDILHAARRQQGLSGLEDVRHAVLEPSGEISIVPKGSPPGRLELDGDDVDGVGGA